MLVRPLLPLGYVLLFFACGSPAPDPADSVDAGPLCTGQEVGGPCDESEAVFDPDHLLMVEVTMDPADFEIMRNQTKGSGSSCQPGPATNNYTYFPASITVDGETVDNVGVRNKGGGSRLVEKPSIKVKFSEYVQGQRYKGMKRMTFNNTSKTDPAYVKQCLGYKLFAAAGVPAPRCNFAKISVNGEDFGIYTHIENIKKPFLARHFADNQGNLYEATGSDFRPEWVDRFELKTNKTTPNRADLDALSIALEAGDSSLLAQLAPLVDVDSVINFWAMEVLLHHTDSFSGLSNNFYVYNDPSTGMFNLIPWGIDNTFKEVGGRNFCKTTMLPYRLSKLPSTWAAFEAKIAELLATVWNTDELLSEIDRIEALISPGIKAGTRGRFAEELVLVREFVSNRKAFFANGTEAWTDVLLPFCWDSGCGPNPGP